MGSFEDSKTSGMIFNIQKYSVHDGPGIRTIVFLKGCPLSCIWCSNPESQSSRPQMAYNEGRCLGLEKCQRCINACPHDAIAAAVGKGFRIHRKACHTCADMACTLVCPSKGMIVYGETVTVGIVLNKVEQDSIFYKRSGGGMTLSGGEPLLQAEFALALLREARFRRIRAAVETCGHIPWETLSAAAKLLQAILFDIKHMDSAKHKQGTGVGNELILENFERLLVEFPRLPVLVRTPVVPGFNDSDEAARSIGKFLAGHGNVSFQALPYHRLGTQKYTFLGKNCRMGEEALPKEVADRFQRIVDEARGG